MHASTGSVAAIPLAAAQIVLNPPPACAAFLAVLHTLLPTRTAAKLTTLTAATPAEVEGASRRGGVNRAMRRRAAGAGGGTAAPAPAIAHPSPHSHSAARPSQRAHTLPAPYAVAALLQRGWPAEAARWVGLASVMPPQPLSLPPLPPGAHRLLLDGIAPPCPSAHAQ